MQMSEGNQSALIHIAYRGGANDDPSGGMNAGLVELTKAWFTEKLVSCSEMCARAATAASPLSGWRSKYDWTLNAVSAAENRPAYTIYVSHCRVVKTLVRAVYRRHLQT